MEVNNRGAKNLRKLKKGIINLLLFLASIAGVMAVMFQGGNAGKLTITGTLIIVSSCYLS